MKNIFRLLCCLFIVTNNVYCQPKICINPPSGYQQGGDFDITTLDGTISRIDNYLCLPEKSAVGRIGVINKSGFAPNTIKYIFGVDNSTTIPAVIPFNEKIDLDGQSSGDFWIMQLGEENNQKRLNCKKIQIVVSDRPTLEISSCDSQDFILKLKTDEPVSYYTIDWKDGNSIEKITFNNSGVLVQHKYLKPTNDLIEVRAINENTTNNRTCSSVPINIKTPTTLNIKSLQTQDFGTQLSAMMNINAANDLKLEVLLSEDSGMSYYSKTSINNNFIQLSNLPKKVLCFKLKHTYNTNCIYYSEPVCTIDPKIDNSTYGLLTLSWNNIRSSANYEITRFGLDPFNLTNIYTTRFIDTNLQCNQSYDYQVKGNYKDLNGNTVNVTSSIIKGKANFLQSLIPTQLFGVNILEDGRPQLELLNPVTSLTYLVNRSKNDESFKRITEIQTSPFVDIVNANEAKYCYTIQYKDACNNLLAISPPVCSIFLEQNLNVLKWNKPSEFPQSTVSYEIKRKEPEETLSVQPGTQFEIRQINQPREKYEIIATIKYTTNNGVYVVKSVSNSVEIDFSVNIFYPEAFSPNNDGVNDIFFVKTDKSYIRTFSMSIYNQWGNLIFESDDVAKGWDGKLQNGDVVSGNYTVKINYEDIFGLKHNRIGLLSLFR